MSKLKSAARKLNPYAVKTAMQMERTRHELAMTMVAERCKEDAEFAAAVLEVAGEHLRPEIKKSAEETIARAAKIVAEGSVIVEARRDEPTVPLAKLEYVGDGAGVSIVKEDVHLGDGFVAVQSDGGGQVIVPETHLPDYPRDGIFDDEQIRNSIGLYEKSGLANAGGCCGGGCGCHVDPNVTPEELQDSLDKTSEDQAKQLRDAGLR